MSAGSQKRTRSDRVASVTLPPGRVARTRYYLQQPDVLVRLGLCVLAALAMWLITGAWTPAFPYRTGYVPPRDVVARVEFSVEDAARTEALRQQARSETLTLYENRSQPLTQLQQALKDKVFLLTAAESYDALEAPAKTVWREFLPETLRAEMSDEAVVFQDFKDALQRDTQLESFQRAVHNALTDWERDGILKSLSHGPNEGNQSVILVHPADAENTTHRVEVKDVRIPEFDAKLNSRLVEEFRKEGVPEQHVDLMAKLVFHWLKPRLEPTLTYNESASRRMAEEAAARVNPVMTTTYAGQTKLALAGQPLTAKQVANLYREHRAVLANMSYAQMLVRGLADFGMFIAMYVLCGVYIWFNERRLLTDMRRFATLLGTVVATVTLAQFASDDQWRAELVPLILFGMTIAVAYRRELALVLSAAVSLVVAISLGQGLAEFVILVSAVAGAVLLLGRIRNRTKLIYVGAFAGLVVTLTTIGVGTVVGQPLGLMKMDTAPVTIELGNSEQTFWQTSFATSLLAMSAWNGGCALITGILMTGLLPFVERLFDVQTDLSLLEMSDAAHPLLQELARRAPGTYNHSINVASIAEAAADSIGANGLLVRVGAYFHDIGKMLKPGYFVENQGQQKNQHESLLPAMSTLVIIAHVKDGADLARQNHLPQSIIDFIEQHHGTTLVEYFYRQAEKRCEEDPTLDGVDESSFRYPGPKPQTKEAGVMMLADAVESACRALVEPAPARIESLVHDIAMRRLMDGQFDQCGMTLQELHTIEASLIKSLIANYHGRVKYPGQASA
ncbi:MAG: HDIG domain-containing protein [Planctomycetales bacterium]|nr:HDIG domain-containing protein [Planctomycetales bacterium]